ncbi:MAG: UvrD-helicase domain-containing protein [Proteobacteria bacterium]|nr:UvrD-helicase domain-containing protein [Pseudomonadota bacterium]
MDKIGLNSKQMEAVNLPAGANALILAGAGSGKTLVLTHRYNKLVQKDNYAPDEILSVTFTNKAANEMRRRILNVTGIRYILPWIGTFHGIANRVLRQHHESIGLRKNYTIIDRAEQIAVLRKIYLEEYKIEKIEKESLAKIADVICRLKEKAVRAEGIDAHIASIGREEGIYLKRAVEIYQSYQKYCQAESLVDFSELILRFYEMLHTHATELDYLISGIRTVLVDEFQDTNDLQYKLVKKLCEKGQSIFVVGDDDQLIYSWRGANPANMKKVLKQFKDVQVVRLEQNYRSTQEILDLANSLIQNNANRMEKKLWSDQSTQQSTKQSTKQSADQPAPTNILLKASTDEMLESGVVRKAVSQWRSQGVPYSQMAILYRKTFLARNLENSLAEAKIPYEIHGGVRFTDRDEVRNAMAWVKVCLDPDDDYCIQRIINVPTRGIGAATLDCIREHAALETKSFFNAAVDLSQSDDIQTRARRALTTFVALVKDLHQYKDLHPRKLLEKLFEKTNMLEYYKAKTSRDVEYSREENLLELLTAADEFIIGRVKADTELQEAATKSDKTTAGKKKAKTAGAKKASTAKKPTKKSKAALAAAAGNGAADITSYAAMTLEFVANTALDSAGPEIGVSNVRDAVQLMTIHAAKGLEFRCVILCGLEEGILPHLSGNHYNEDENSEEERRLCYVAITRARENLVLSCVRNRNVRGKYSFSEPSRFVYEMFVNDPARLELAGLAEEGGPPAEEFARRPQMSADDWDRPDSKNLNNATGHDFGYAGGS